MSGITNDGTSLNFTVTVTNTGSVAGKDVVEIYSDPPYTNGGIEKSTANLLDFAKTSELAPGESQTIEFSIPVEDLASYDYQTNGCYVLEAGDYVISANDETVVLLSHKKADSYIHIDVEFGEGEGKIPVDSIAKRAEAYKPKEKVTYKMIKEYIEAKYGFKVHTAYIAEVKRDLGLPMYDAPNAVEELKQPRKHPTPEKVEAIKDALKHFEII